VLEPYAGKLARTVLRGARGRQRPLAYSTDGCEMPHTEYIGPFEEGSGCGKWILFSVAAGVGVAVAVVTANKFDTGLPTSILLGLISFGAYPILAAVGAKVCLRLRILSFPRKGFTSDVVLMTGILWPVAVPFWLVVAPFFALTNRFFKARNG